MPQICSDPIHSEAIWLFRATLDVTADSNWTSLLPAVWQFDYGNYCDPKLAVPNPWAGSKGVVGVVQHNGEDGILFQCAAVNFVAGIQSTVPKICNNDTGLKASLIHDPELSPLANGSAGSWTPLSNMTAESSSKTFRCSSYSSFGALLWVWLVIISAAFITTSAL